MSKYIVKNCPAFIPQAYEHCCNLDGNYKCEGCTDCRIKRVIDKCNSRKGTIMENFAEQILDIFDIQEVEE